MKIAPIGLLLCTLTMTGFGCSPTQRVAEETTEATINSQLGGAGSVDIQDGTVQYQDTESGTKAAWGENVEIPDEFPSDLPVYENGTVVGVTVTTTGAAIGAWVSVSTTDTPSQAVSWYADRLTSDGWTQQASYSMQDMEMRTFAKGGASITVSAGSSGTETGETVVTAARTES